MINLPWWIMLIILLVFLSGYMAYRAMRAEYKLEQKFIEKEGEVYMERIKNEQRRRQQQ